MVVVNPFKKYIGVYDLEGNMLYDKNIIFTRRSRENTLNQILWNKYKDLRGKEGYMITLAEHSPKFSKVAIRVVRFKLFNKRTLVEGSPEYGEDIAMLYITKEWNSIYVSTLDSDNTVEVTKQLMKMGKLIPLVTELTELLKAPRMVQNSRLGKR